MMAQWLARLSSGCLLVGSLGCAAVACRLMVCSSPSWGRLLKTAEARRVVPLPARRVAPPPGPWRSLRLSVTLGPARAAVVVGGQRLGDSPYLGDFSCREGELVRVEVVPPEGAPLVRQVRCDGAMIRLE